MQKENSEGQGVTESSSVQRNVRLIIPRSATPEFITDQRSNIPHPVLFRSIRILFVRIRVRVVPNAKKAKVEETETGLKVWVDAPATDGKANRRLIEILAEHFGVKKSSIRIVKGEKSREKIVEITLPT